MQKQEKDARFLYLMNYSNILSAWNCRTIPKNILYSEVHIQGKGGYRGRRKEGKGGAMHPNYFLSSTHQIKRDTVTKLWQAIVKKQLGIDKYMYCMKHTGGDDKILAGVDMDALRNLYGHGSKRMTETYTKKIKGVYKNEIINKAPEFINRLS